MSVYDDMREVMEDARMEDECDYSVYSQMFDLIGDVEAENKKLRELVRKYGEYTDQDRCEGCVCKSRCSNGDVDECWQLIEIRELASELGIRVGE